MTFLNIPLKSVQVAVISVEDAGSMAWNNPLLYPVIPPAAPPAPVPRDFRWRVELEILEQSHSSSLTRDPGRYTGQDIQVGQWIANLSSGQAWQIIVIESKTQTTMTAIVQDIYRYNTFRDTAQVGNGSPLVGTYVAFSVGDTGLPQIDPVPSASISAQFATNLASRFEYINLQYDFPLFQQNNTFQFNDVIAVDPVAHAFVLANATNKTVVGRITSISDTIPGWFTINPVQKIVDYLDFLPGNIGDIIYSSTTSPGELTLTSGGSQIYIKLRNNTSSTTTGTLSGPTQSGNIIQVNGIDVEVSGAGSAADLAAAIDAESAATGVNAGLALAPAMVETDTALITSTYGEPALFAINSPASATINGVTVTFDITSTDPGYEDYARAVNMAQSINNANIPNIVADTPSVLVLRLTNTAGSSISIVNGASDINGVPFAGTNSGSGLALTTPTSTNSFVQLTAVDSRPINLLDVVGTTLDDFGLVSVENGVKACGLYVEGGLRTASTTVVTDLAQLNALAPLIGDQAYVIDSNDGAGNNVGEWSTWIYNGVDWTETSNEDSASTDAKSLEYTVTSISPAAINIGKISTGRRATLITVEVTTPFNGTPTLDIGYQVDNPVPPAPEPAGLMTQAVIDLSVAGTYTTSTDVLFGTDTAQGDVTITADFAANSATTGSAQIIVSYV